MLLASTMRRLSATEDMTEDQRRIVFAHHREENTGKTPATPGPGDTYA